MKNINLETSIKRLFHDNSSRSAMFLSGSLTASILLGVPAHEALQTLSDGFSIAIGHTPFASTIDAANTFFSGAFHWLGVTAVDVSEQISELGGEIGHRSMEFVSHARHYLGDNLGSAKAYFSDKAAKVGESLRIWKTSVTNSVFKDTSSLLSYCKDVLLGAAEIWGACEALHKAYTWVTGKVFKSKRKQAKKQGEEFSAATTNVNFNITLNASRDGNVERALEKFSEQITEKIANPETIRKCGCLARDGMTQNMASSKHDQEYHSKIVNDIIADSDEVISISHEINRQLRQELGLHSAKPVDQNMPDIICRNLDDWKEKNNRYMAVTKDGDILESDMKNDWENIIDQIGQFLTETQDKNGQTVDCSLN